jgi:polyribonucleotide 5'-hydroxyl-kinase
VLVVGQEDSGKSTFANILLNYAVRSGHTPIFVDLDVGLNDLAAPGAVAASPLVHPRDIEEDEFPSILPLVYYFGYTSLAENKEVRLLAGSVED